MMKRGIVFVIGIAIIALGAAIVLLPPRISQTPAPTSTPAAAPTPDPAIYNQVPETTFFAPGQCAAVLNAPAPAYTSNMLGGPPGGEIPPGSYEVGAAAKYSTSLWYALNNVGAANYILSTSVALLNGECDIEH